VRSLDLKPSLHLTTGTFNLVVNDRFAVPPKRLRFDRGGRDASRPCPRLLLPGAEHLRVPLQEANFSNLPRMAAPCQTPAALLFSQLLTLLVQPSPALPPAPKSRPGASSKSPVLGSGALSADTEPPSGSQKSKDLFEVVSDPSKLSGLTRKPGFECKLRGRSRFHPRGRTALAGRGYCLDV
jgi:hypothetical protein